MAKPLVIEFKDPDFASALEAAGVQTHEVERLCKLADLGEYWKLLLLIDEQGVIRGARFVDANK